MAKQPRRKTTTSKYVDKELYQQKTTSLENDIKEIKDEVKYTERNIENKIDLVEERIGKKLDRLMKSQEETDEDLNKYKGNGSAGVWGNNSGD